MNFSFVDAMTKYDELIKESVKISGLINSCFDQVVREALAVHLITAHECTSFLSPNAGHMTSCLNGLLDGIRLAIKNDNRNMETFIAILRDIEYNDLATELGM